MSATITYPPGRPSVELSSANVDLHIKQIAKGVNRALQGHINSTFYVTLTANAASTMVSDTRISPSTCASFQPQTAHAAADAGTLYAVCTDGSMTIHHANNTNTDRTFTVGIVG